MKIQEVSEDITKWRNSISSPKTNFKKENTKKDDDEKKLTKMCRNQTNRQKCTKQQQQPSLIPLSGVGYMDQITP